MSYNLFDITYRVARELDVVAEGVATGGSTTTIIDNVMLTQYENDHFNRGAAWIIRDAGGASAAPEGEYQRVSDFTGSTGTILLATALSSSVASGDRYAAMNKRYTLDTLISMINSVLATIPIPTTDITSLDTAQNQTEYTLPTALLDEGVEVWLQTITDDTDDNQWIPYHDWYIQETGTGTAKKLVFRTQPMYNYAVKLVYYTPHPPLYSRTDKLREGIDINRVVLESAYRCLLHKKAEAGVTDPYLDQRINELAVRVNNMKWSTNKNRKKPKLQTLGEVDYGERDLIS